MTTEINLELTSADLALIDRWIADHGGNIDRATAVLRMIRAAGDIVEIEQIDLSDPGAIDRLIKRNGA